MASIAARHPTRAKHPAASLATLLGARGSRAVVLFFVASDCPISNRYMPELQRIEQEFQGRQVRFWFVYPNITETHASIHAHQAAYAGDGHILTDAKGRLTALTGARVTPEAAVLVPGGSTLHTVFTGRVDDRYLSFGVERPQPTRHDLEAALTAALAHQPVAPPGGAPVGCAILGGQ